MEEQLLPEDNSQPVEKPPRPWGFWPTIGFSMIITAAFFFVQCIIVIIWTVGYLIQNQKLEVEQFANNLVKNGLFQSVFLCAVAPVTIGLSILFSEIRKGITIKQYLGFRYPGWTKIVKWCLVVIVFAVISDMLIFFSDDPVIAEYMTSTYKTAFFLPLFWFAIIIAGPLSEEIFFRGFLFEGIRYSKVGAAGAVIITSLIWSTMHLQYNIYGIIFIFVGGLLLGYVRIRSNSIYPPIAMHILHNIIASVEVVVYVEFFHTTG
ncbi:MAG: CPBP family intramembrane metalloprotease [Sedimentisphaerales bacterium]|nr:CPBP family intramembrane metalloprotease [Sedimentisphaerales bacterium]